MSHNHAKHEVLIKLDISAPISKNITCLRPSYSILLEASTSVCKSPLVLEKKNILKDLIPFAIKYSSV